MARNKNNPLLKSISGKFGHVIVYKDYWYGTVMSNYPDMSNVKPSEKQLVEKYRFADAVRYAKAIIADPEKKAALQKRIPRRRSVYNAAIAEFMKKKV